MGLPVMTGDWTCSPRSTDECLGYYQHGFNLEKDKTQNKQLGSPSKAGKYRWIHPSSPHLVLKTKLTLPGFWKINPSSYLCPLNPPT